MKRNFTTLFLLPVIALFLCTNVNAQFTLDWSSSFTPAWSAGATSGNATNIGGTSSRNLAVTTGFTGTGVFSGAYPAVNINNGNAGIFEVQASADAIEFDIDLANRTSYLTVTFTFTGGPIQNVTFGISDIDRPTGATPYSYMDSITVVGTGPSGTVLPTITKYNAASNYVTITGNAAYATEGTGGGTASSLNQGIPDQDATVFVNFAGGITSFTVTYATRNLATGATNPGLQAIALGNITFNNGVPPTTSNITNPILSSAQPAVDINDFTASDDESIAGYNILTLPASGSLTYFNGSTYVAVPTNTVLTQAQVNSIRYDPAISAVGNVTFTFNAVDNRGLLSTTATYTIPVESAPPPVILNRVAPVMKSNQGQTAIPALVGNIAYGSVDNYTILTLPSAASGILYLCDPACVAVLTNQTITSAQRDKLRFDPAAGFNGTASFTYNGTSNSSIAGNTATYNIPVRSLPPIANTIYAEVIRNTFPATAIPSLSGADPDGTVASYTITSLPTVAQGVLYFCNPTCVPVTLNQSILPADIGKLQFDPDPAYIGNVRFTYTVTDNNSNISPSAVYNIPVKGSPSVNLPPLAEDIVSNPLPNTLAATLVSALVGRDADGTISSYTFETIPPASEGVLSYCSNGSEPCSGGGVVTPITAGANIAAALLTTLKFDPAATFSGTASFTYTATDNSSQKSNTALYSIPVTNRPPVAQPITSQTLSNTFAATAIPALIGTDDGSVTTYTITSLPAVGAGTLTLCNPGCAAVTANQTIPLADLGKLQFDPLPAFTGNATFTYTVTDNNTLVSTAATYTIPVIVGTQPAGTPPVADNKIVASMPNTNGSTALSAALSGTDADGTVAGYVIGTVPPTTAGVLNLCTPGCVVVAPGTTISLANVGNLQFDPAPGFEGDALFSYAAVDNSGKTSSAASYTIPVTAAFPRAVNVQSANLSLSAPATPIPSLSATDADGTIASYVITSLPPADAGVLTLCNPGCAPVTVGQIILAADAGSLQFDPAPGYKGLYSGFNYYAVDNNAKTSNVATYTLQLFLGSALPVTLLNFSADERDNIATVKWSTEQELSLKEFVVERSIDGLRFSDVGTVPAKSGSARNEYSLPDDISRVNANVIYYRLRIIDKDAGFKYSPVATVTKNRDLKPGVLVLPNPVENSSRLRITYTGNAMAEIQVVNAGGSVVLRNRQLVSRGDNYVYVSGMNELPQGSYTVRVLMGETVLNARFVKTKN